MTEKLAWGILATGKITQAFARGLAASQTGRLVAVGSRSQESADKFGAEFNVPRRHGSYEALLADPEVQAVYIAPPHPMHAQWAIAAAETGKHVLCEKPLTLNYPEGMAVVEAARRNNVFLMEAFMYRCHPQTIKLVELIRERAIGQVKVIQAAFGFGSGFRPDTRVWANEFGGGGILDVGCYPISMSRLIAGVAQDRAFADPLDLKAVGSLHPISGTDSHTVAVLKFSGDVLAQAATAVGVALENVVRIFGTGGSIYLGNPWTHGRTGGGEFKIALTRKGQTEEIITIKTEVSAYTYEADVVANAIAQGRREAPDMSWDDTLGNLRALDQWRAQIGLTYEQEQPAKLLHTVHRKPLAVQQPTKMKYGQIAGVTQPVSRLVMGCDNQATMPQAAIMFDDFFERGGNTFDTANIYGRGLHEQLLGQWIKNRGIRAQVVVIAKGAHTPNCNPKALTAQLKESLERMNLDYADIYLMHRDNLEVPVGEFVEVLNEHLKAGRIRVFGGSNWTLERIHKANAYAKRKGLTGFAVVSNNFSLARMVNPVWEGCIAASDPESRKWLKRTQMPLLPWSSQARGFFTERAVPDTPAPPDASLAHCWYSEDNWERRKRAFDLAKQRGVLPIQVALAYVLCQPFPTFPLIGPRTLFETATSFPALDIELSAKDLAWLNLET